jgi:hypothetical protein
MDAFDPLPSPYELSARRVPGQAPVEILEHAPNWAKFLDKQSNLQYYLSRTNGECTYQRPAVPAEVIVCPPVQEQQQVQHQQAIYSTNGGVGGGGGGGGGGVGNVDADFGGTGLPTNTEDYFRAAMESPRNPNPADAASQPGAIPLPPPTSAYPTSQGGFDDSRFRQQPPAGAPSSSAPVTTAAAAAAAAPAAAPAIIRDLDMNLFKACRDRKVEAILDHLIGKTAPFFDPDLFSDVNVGWHAKRDGGGWDAIPSTGAFEMQQTSFFWPADTSGEGSGSGAPATEGDTLLHIAIKLKRKDLVRWLSETGDRLDLNQVNARGETAAQIADRLGLSNMYNYFFVLK